MEVPINKNENILMRTWIEDKYNICIENHFVEHMIEANIESFKNNDFYEEYKFINQISEDIESPIVFTHNDYRSDNLMVLTDE